MNLPYSYIKASDGSGNASAATVQNVRSAGATTLNVDTVQGISNNFIGTMGTPHTFTDPVTGETITIISEATAVDFAGHVDGSSLEIDEIAPGYTDAGSEVGDIIIIKPTTLWADLLAEALTPTGVVSPFAGSTAPENWLLCDGSAVSRTTYERLYNLIGTTFGVGDGSSTFNLPDLRSRVAIGVGTGTWSFIFESTDVTVATDQIAVTASPEFKTGRKIQLTTTGTLPTGLAAATDYYIIVIDSTHIQLATSEANAFKGTAIDITAQGTGTNTGTGTLSARTLGEHGGRESHSHDLSSRGGTPYGLDSSKTYVNRDYSGPTFSRSTLNNEATTWSGSSATNINSAIGLVGDTDVENVVPPYVALNYIIKT